MLILCTHQNNWRLALFQSMSSLHMNMPEAMKVLISDAELKMTVILLLRGPALWPLCSSRVLILTWWHQRSPLKEWMRKQRAVFGKKEQTWRRELEIFMLTASTAWNMRGNIGCFHIWSDVSTTGRRSTTREKLFKAESCLSILCLSTSITAIKQYCKQWGFTKRFHKTLIMPSIGQGNR